MVQDAWKNFELSGRVSDYLAYKQSMGQNTLHEPEEKTSFLERGMNRYGTEHSSDGNGVKHNANWRI